MLRSVACKILATDVGTPVRLREICPWCQTTHEALPTLHQKSLEQRVTQDGRFNSFSIRAQRKSCLVDSRRKDKERGITRTENPGALNVFRRFQTELGSNSGEPSSNGNMVSCGEKRAHQYLGIKGDLLCTRGAAGDSERQDSGDFRRQHHSPVIYKKARGHEIVEVIPPCRRTTVMGREGRDHLSSEIYRGQEEQSSGHIEQERADSNNRMDLERPGVPVHLEDLGTSPDRLFRDIPNNETALLLLPSSRSECDRGRRPPTRLGQSGPICVPSVCDNSESAQQGEEICELQSNPGSSLVATKGVVPRSHRHASRHPKSSSPKKRPPPATSVKSTSHRVVHTSANRLEVILNLTREKGLSAKVSERIFKARATSTNSLYQLRWGQFVKWCKDNRYSAIRPSIDTICKFFIFLWEERKLSIGTIKGFRSVIQSVLRHNDINISQNQDISDVIKSFIIERPVAKKTIVGWNIDIVLKHLCSSKYEPLNEISLRDLTKKTLFLLTMALAKRVSEMQAISCDVGFTQEGAIVSLTMGFRAKNDNKVKRLPRNFTVKSLTQLVGQEEERKLCPVRALRAYLERTKSLREKQVKNLFLAPKNPLRPASKNALAYFLKTTVLEAHRNVTDETLRICKVKSQEVRAVSTSLSFAHNMSIDSVIEAAQWRSNTVFAGHYLKEVSVQYENCRSLGPIVAAGTIIV